MRVGGGTRSSSKLFNLLPLTFTWHQQGYRLWKLSFKVPYMVFLEAYHHIFFSCNLNDNPSNFCFFIYSWDESYLQLLTLLLPPPYKASLIWILPFPSWSAPPVTSSVCCRSRYSSSSPSWSCSCLWPSKCSLECCPQPLRLPMKRWDTNSLILLLSISFVSRADIYLTVRQSWQEVLLKYSY